jgi:hypothetical protein
LQIGIIEGEMIVEGGLSDCVACEQTRDEVMLDMAQKIRNRAGGHFLEQVIGRVPASHQDMVPFDLGLRSRRVFLLSLGA